MGAWGIGNFDNDTAMDWLQEFHEQPTEAALSEVFSNVTENDEFIDADEGSMLLVAAEIIAAIKSRKNNDYPDEVRLFDEIKVQNDLSDKALKAIDMVSQSDDSELKQLWQETEDFGRWNAVVIDLKNRIQ